MRNTVRTAIPTILEGQPQAQPQAQQPPLTWTGDYLLQLAQALTTGAMVAGLVAAFWYWSAQGDLPSWWWSVCLTVLGVWATFWTIVRFHGPETGLMRAWYRAGQRSRDGQIAALELELHAAYASAASSQPVSAEATRQLTRANATIAGARQILTVLFESGAGEISRAKMQRRNLGPNDWRAAMRLLRAAGVIDDEGQPLVREFRLALRMVEEYHGRDVSQMRQSKTYHPAWL